MNCKMHPMLIFHGKLWYCKLLHQEESEHATDLDFSFEFYLNNTLDFVLVHNFNGKFSKHISESI